MDNNLLKYREARKVNLRSTTLLLVPTLLEGSDLQIYYHTLCEVFLTEVKQVAILKDSNTLRKKIQCLQLYIGKESFRQWLELDSASVYISPFWC